MKIDSSVLKEDPEPSEISRIVALVCFLIEPRSFQIMIFTRTALMRLSKSHAHAHGVAAGHVCCHAHAHAHHVGGQEGAFLSATPTPTVEFLVVVTAVATPTPTDSSADENFEVDLSVDDPKLF